jgi:hypothetical protein
MNYPGINLMTVGARRLMGVDLVWSPHAVRTEWLFPPSKNRSRRIHKKLMKRFGRQTVQHPAVYQVHGTLYAHPSFRDKLEQRITKQIDDSLYESMLGTLSNTKPAPASTLTAEHMTDLARRVRELGLTPLPSPHRIGPLPLWPKGFG